MVYRVVCRYFGFTAYWEDWGENDRMSEGWGAGKGYFSFPSGGEGVTTPVYPITNENCQFVSPGADELEPATPIPSLCHGIFID